jgi:hypothetical protein
MLATVLILNFNITSADVVPAFLKGGFAILLPYGSSLRAIVTKSIRGDNPDEAHMRWNPGQPSDSHVSERSRMGLGSQVCKAVGWLRWTGSPRKYVFLGKAYRERRTIRCERKYGSGADVAAWYEPDRDKSAKWPDRCCENQ